MENLFNNTILIVDDTTENIDILVDLLENYNTKIATNGEDALEMIFEGSLPDLILLDIIMPGIDGYEVCRRIRANDKTKEIPIIFFTVKDSQDDILMGFELGGQDYITKPFDSRELFMRVKTQLELKTQREILKNMNVVLEEKVQERTSQLQNALSKLDVANRELQSLNTAKNNFLHMISHEIRTPLNGIIGPANLLMDAVEHDSELRKFADILQNSVERLEEFSTTALLITQLQVDHYKISRNPHNIQKLIHKSIQSLKEYSIKQNIDIAIGIINPLLEINMDEKLFYRVLKGSIHNALKYSPKNSKVIVNAYTTDEKSIVEIIDEGDGFTDEALNRLFQPFGIGEEHYDNNVGLCLFLARIIMKKHSGDLSIENLPESGAKVKFTFNN